MSWSTKVTTILSNGISLHEVGTKNWALRKDQALRALNELEEIGIPVLGGDVYELKDGVPESNYDNWYVEKEDKESIDDFTRRSINKARLFINNYISKSGLETLFVLVPDTP